MLVVALVEASMVELTFSTLFSGRCEVVFSDKMMFGFISVTVLSVLSITFQCCLLLARRRSDQKQAEFC